MYIITIVVTFLPLTLPPYQIVHNPTIVVCLARIFLISLTSHSKTIRLKFYKTEADNKATKQQQQQQQTLIHSKMHEI